jgi:hypothetical protein
MCHKAHSVGWFCACETCVANRRLQNAYDPKTHNIDKKYKWRDFLLFMKATHCKGQKLDHIGEHLRDMFSVTQEMIRCDTIRLSERDYIDTIDTAK